MIVSKLTPLNLIKIIAPRYHDRTLLIARYKVKEMNKIEVEKGAYQGTYFMRGDHIRSCPLDTNGKIDCYSVPLDKLEPLEYREDVSRLAVSLFEN
jgi:hypothetical protein